MYDHVLLFKDEASALKILNVKEFDISITISNLSITIEGNPIPGYYVCVTLDEPSKELMNLPNYSCRVVTDREAAAIGDNFFVYVSPDLDVALLTLAKIEPTFMGSEYPYGTGI